MSELLWFFLRCEWEWVLVGCLGGYGKMFLCVRCYVDGVFGFISVGNSGFSLEFGRCGS